MSEPLIRDVRLVQTCLLHPERQVERHVLVSTRRYEGYNPENNYNDDTETMAFPTWDVRANPDELLQRHHHSEGIYEAHNNVVREFLSKGYRKLKTRIMITPEGFNPKVRTYSLTSSPL